MMIYRALNMVFPHTFLGKASTIVFLAVFVPSVVWIAMFFDYAELPLGWNPRLVVGTLSVVWLFACIMAMKSLLEPLALTMRFLDSLERDGQKISLPVNYQDEIGRVLQAVNSAPVRLGHRLRSNSSPRSVDAPTGQLSRSGFLEIVPNVPTGSIFFLQVTDFQSDSCLREGAVYDRMISDVANALAANLRMEDLVARWDENTFCCWMPRIDKHSTHSIVDRLTTKLQKEMASKSYDLQFTIGYSMADGKRSFEELRHMAQVANQDALTKRRTRVAECRSTPSGISIRSFRRRSLFSNDVPNQANDHLYKGALSRRNLQKSTVKNVS